MRGVEAASNRSTKRRCRRLDIDEHLAQSALGHDDHVRRQRVEQFVGENDAVNGVGQGGGAVREQRGVGSKRLDLRGAGGGRLFDEREADGGVEVGVVSRCAASRMSRDSRPLPAPASTRSNRSGGSDPAAVGANADLPHLGELLRQQLAEDRPDVDAGKKIARAPRLLGRAGVVAKLRMVERDLHELREADGAARPDAVGYQLAKRHLSLANGDELLLAARA